MLQTKEKEMVCVRQAVELIRVGLVWGWAGCWLASIDLEVITVGAHVRCTS